MRNKLNFVQPHKTTVDEPRNKYQNRIIAAMILIPNASPTTFDKVSISHGCAYANIWKESSVGIGNEFAYSLN